MEPTQHLLMHFPPNLEKYGSIFLSAYQPLPVLFSDAGKTVKLKQKSLRVCRFCGKGSDRVNFRKKAHKIPELLGNRYMLSDFECDTCNEKFGKFENDLAIYCAPMLAMQGTRGKEGRRSLASKGKKIMIPFVFDGIELTLITKPDPDDDSMDFNHDTGKNSFRFSKNAYTPVKVYKAFLKAALSCLPEVEFKYYSYAVRFLHEDSWDEKNMDFAKITLHTVPMGSGHHAPVIFIYKKRDPQAAIPTHIFVMRFANCYVQFMLPFYDPDIIQIYNKEVAYPVCPPVFTTPSPDISPTFFNVDLHSFEKQKAEEVNLSFDTDPDILKKNGVVYDHQTDTFKPLDAFESIASAVMAPSHTSFTNEQLGRLAKVIQELNEKQKI
ncbi:MAG: hypothetical protein I8H66_12060 [Sphingobacteriia bacterium]|nr:hypothetical protein [Sphingobacteriia bacterium]